MVNSKKLLSLFLAVVMLLSVFTVMASAYTRGETEGTADIDIKYTVEKVDTVPETAAGSAEWSADNIYAVTVWMKSAKPVDILITPFHYNKTLFAPITLSDGECTYPYGAGLDQDTYYTDMGEGAVYAYSLGDYMNNTGMYKANGTTATTKALAKCIGLGNANSEGIKVTTELVSPDHPLYNKWGAGLPADTGVVYSSINVAGKTKTAYFNTIEGITTSTDWNRMFTLYFEAIADDVTGAEFGVFTDDCFTVDGNYDGKGLGYFQGATNYQALVPSMNVVENAVVEAAETPIVPLTISHWKNQIRFDKNSKDEFAGTFDARMLMSIDNFDEVFASVDAAKAAVIDAGYLFNKGTAIDVDTAKAQVEGGAATYSQVKNVYVSTYFSAEKAYVMSCMIQNIPEADKTVELSAMAYVVYTNAKGETAYAYSPVVTSTFETLYNDNFSNAFPNG